jgi:hypothetical protein
VSERPLELVLPGDLQTPTGGYRYDRRIVAGLRELGWRVGVHSLDASFPFPTATAVEHARSVFAEFRDGSLVLVDGLAFGAMPEVVTPHSARLDLVALVHHPLAAESGLAESVAQALARSERLSLQLARHVIVTSRATREALFKDYQVQSEKISIVEPGTDEAPCWWILWRRWRP